MKKPQTVDDYIRAAPRSMQKTLRELRALIRATAPEAIERISYGMPFYDYYGRLVYFSAAKKYIGLYIPPPVIHDHASALKNYVTTKSAVHLPTDQLPRSLIKTLIKARMRYNKSLKNKK